MVIVSSLSAIQFWKRISRLIEVVDLLPVVMVDGSLPEALARGVEALGHHDPRPAHGLPASQGGLPGMVLMSTIMTSESIHCSVILRFLVGHLIL